MIVTLAALLASVLSLADGIRIRKKGWLAVLRGINFVLYGLISWAYYNSMPANLIFLLRLSLVAVAISVSAEIIARWDFSAIEKYYHRWGKHDQ